MNKTTRKNNKNNKNNKKGLRKTRSKKQRGGSKDEDIALLNASRDGNIEEVKYLLNKERHWFYRANVDARTYDNDTALTMASLGGEKGHIEIVEVLLNNGADVNAYNNCGNTALINASEVGHIKIVEMLLKKGADLDASNNLDETALMIASENGHKEVVEMLLDYGADVKTLEEVHKGVLSNAQNRSKFLKEKRQNNEDLKESRENDLQECKEKILKKQEGEKEIFLKKQEDEKEIFLKKCFEHINRKYITTPTDNVLKNPDLTREIAKYLRKEVGGKKGRKTRSKQQKGGAGKALTIRDYFPSTYNKEQANRMLLRATYDLELDDIIEALEKGADINVKGEDGNTALHMAIEDGDIQIVEYLLKNGADIYIKDKYGDNAIELAREYDHNEYTYEDDTENPFNIEDIDRYLENDLENDEDLDQMLPGVTIRDGPILRLLKIQDVKNRLKKHLEDRSRRQTEKELLSKIFDEKLGKNKHQDVGYLASKYLGGKSKRKSKTQKRKKQNKGSILNGICVLNENNNNVKGTIKFKNINNKLYIKYNISGLSDGEHGFHVHEYGDLSDNCNSGCSHFNPFNESHGGPNSKHRHAGDLGNIISKNNIAKGTIVDKILSLDLNKKTCIVGRMIIVHEKKDDLGEGNNEESLKTGNAGKRLACGIIGITK